MEMESKAACLNIEQILHYTAIVFQFVWLITEENQSIASNKHCGYRGAIRIHHGLPLPWKQSTLFSMKQEMQQSRNILQVEMVLAIW